MKDMEKLYDLLNSFKKGNIDADKNKMLEQELGDMEAFEHLENRILNELRHSEKPSENVKNKLDAAFENRFKANNPHHLGIIPIRNINSRKPWKAFAYAASVSLFLYFTVQVGFNDIGSINNDMPLLADSIGEISIDSNQISVDSLVLPN